VSNLRGIETFVRVVEGGSIAAAARHLGITAAAASQNLARLEKELGTRLLTRTTRSQALTAAGEAYFAQVSPLLDGLVQSRTELSALQGAVQGRLKLACSVSFGRHVVAPLVPAFMARYPQVRVEMVMADRNVDHLKEDWTRASAFAMCWSPAWWRGAPPARPWCFARRQPTCASMAAPGDRRTWRTTPACRFACHSTGA